MRLRHSLVVTLGLTCALIACGPSERAEPSADTSSVASPLENERPVLAGAGLDIVAKIVKAGDPWDGDAVFDDTNFTGGSINLYRRLVSYPMGSITVDRTEDGSIFYVLARSGMGDRCGSIEPVERAFTEMAQSLRLPAVTAQQRDAMLRGWRKAGGITEFNTPHAQIVVLGGCLPGVSIKAT